jgi:single-strand DNA-binding protein
MASLNKVMLIGRLGKDPEVKGRDGGFVTFRIATSRKYKDRDGNPQENTQWHSIAVFAKPSVEYAKKYLHKGDLVYVEGELQTREHEGKYYTEVVIQPFNGTVQGLGGSKSEGGAPRSSGGGSEDYERSGHRSDGYGTGGFGDDGDDIPF